MSRPPARRRPGDPSTTPPNCQPYPQPTNAPRTGEPPSLGTIIAGIAGIAGAVGLGYLLGSTSRDEPEETDRAGLGLAERRRQQLRQQQQLASAAYYPGQYSNRSQQHTEIKEATDHTASQPAASKPPQPSPFHASQPASAAVVGGPGGGSVSVSAPLSSSASAPLTGAGREGADEDDANLCKICFDRPLDSVLFPCRHQCCCHVCSGQINECPVCRSTITSAVQIYRS